MALGDKKPVVMEEDKAIPGGIATLGTDGKLVQMPSAADVGAVNKAGDTMTGNLTINTAEDTGRTMLIDANTYAIFAKIFGQNHAQIIPNASDNTFWANYSTDGGKTFSTNKLLHTGNYTDYALPRDGSAAMTGNLKIWSASPRVELLHSKNNGGFFIYKDNDMAFIQNNRDGDASGNYNRIIFYPSGNENGIVYQEYENGQSVKWAKILHTGNKPSSSYNGDGNATAENLCTGATGNMAVIWGNGKFTVITENGGVCSDGTTLTSAQVKFSGGTLTVSTNDERVNKLSSPVTKYYWQVL